MTNKKYTIGISCIGSGVGQSIINSLNLSRLPITKIGLGTNPFAYGAYDCDNYDYTKSIYDADYIENLLEVCKKHKIELLIPGLDDEVLLLSKNIDKLSSENIKVICAKTELVSICRDKEKMSYELNKVTNNFVKCLNKNTLLEDIKTGNVTFPFIAKPRSGFASRGIEIIRNQNDLTKINDSHILQELAIPVESDPNYNFYLNQIEKNINPQVSEISIQLVFDDKGKPLGRMSSYNKLNNGIPIEIVPYENLEVWDVIDKLTPTLLDLGLCGPLNIQGRITKDGLKLFEMNPRFTGITGLRALMGFNEVESCVKEWLNIDSDNNKLFFNYGKFGIRQTADKAIPIERNNEVERLYQDINHKKVKEVKSLLITGACGYLGQSLINNLLSNKNFELIVFDLDKAKLIDLYDQRVSSLFDLNDLVNGHIHLGNIDILVHLGFTRPYGKNEQIAQSLEFTHELFTRASLNNVPAILNISSQSVYGQASLPPWTEDSLVSPQIVYSQAKYATELLLKSLSSINKSLRYSSIRLCTLAGGAPGLIEIDLLSRLVRQSINNENLYITGGEQLLERLDIRDASDAIAEILNKNPEEWDPIYNLGSGEVYSLHEIARRVIEEVTRKGITTNSEIIIEEKDIRMNFGLDSKLFRNKMNWIPKYSLSETIDSLICYFLESRKKID